MLLDLVGGALVYLAMGLAVVAVVLAVLAVRISRRQRDEAPPIRRGVPRSAETHNEVR